MAPDVRRALGPEPATGEGAPRPRAGRLALSVRGWLASEGGRFLVSSSPVLLVFLLGEWLVFTGGASFAGVLGFGGVIANSLTAGIFPVLLLAAGRRKGEYTPGVAYRLVGHPAFIIAVYGLSVANLLAHGLFIYSSPWARGSALLFAGAVLGVSAAMLARGAFAPRSVIELREDARKEGGGVLTVTSGGRPLEAGVRLGRAAGEEEHQAAAVAVPAIAGLGHVAVCLPAGPAREVKVWAHRVTPEGSSEPLPALVEVAWGGQTRRFDLRLSGGQTVVATGGAGCEVRMTFPEPGSPGG